MLERLQLATRPLVTTGNFTTVRYDFISGITFAPGDVFYVGAEELVSDPGNIGIAADASGGLTSWAAFTGNNPTTATTVNTTANFGGNFAKDLMIQALTTAPIPEPSSAAMLCGLVALGCVSVRRRITR